MWIKIFLPITILLMTTSVQAAEVSCKFVYGICYINNVTPILTPNETITIAGGGIDTTTSYVLFNSTIVRYVPTKIFSVFTNLNQFGLTNTFTTNLVTDAFVNCQSLTAISIYNQNFPNVPEGFAQSYSKVGTIHMINAGIQTIDVNAFKGLRSLSILLMGDNKLTCIQPGLFDNTPLISWIDFKNCKILAIDNGVFKNLPYLHAVDLSNNLLTYLPSFDFTGSAVLNGNLGLTLAGNPINAIQPTLCNFFNSRPASVVDIFDFAGIKCLPNTPQTASIFKSNCQTTMATYLQKCYANWTLAMYSPVPCSSPACAQFLWQQFLNFLKNLVY